MGKLGPRLSSRKKAKRWLKGQSSSSNPNTRKYRDQARSRFFQENLGLTVDDLRKHDAIQGVQKDLENITIDDDEATTGTFKTFDTFASDWSSCSNLSFDRFLNRFQASSAIHKEMLAILAAVTDVIKQNGGTESSTEYYAALMTTLVKVTESEESVAAVLSLLGMGLKTVPRNVLRLQFGQASQTFLQILTKYATSENFLILRTCIGCLSLLLRIPEIAVWSDSSTLQVLDAILTFTVHTKPRVRKAAQHAICAILKGSDIMRGDDAPVCHPGAPQVAKHCLAQLEAAGQPGGITTTLHVLTLLKDVSHQLPKSYLKSVCESLLRIMTLNNVLVTSCCLQTLHGLFVSRPSEAILPSQLNAQIINALYDYQPTSGDTQPTLAWLAVMQEAHSNLATHSLALCAANIPRIVETCTELWLSDKVEVLTGASHTIKALLQTCVDPLCKCEQDANKYKPVISKVIQLIQRGMKYQYNSAWHHVLHLLALLFQIAGRVCEDELLGILTALAELRDSYKFTYNAEVEYAVGAAITTMGPRVVLTAIPLQTNEDEININRSWLLPALKNCVKQASLSYFIESLLPLAMMCEKRSAALRTGDDAIKAHSYDLLTSQIWSLLPSFCNHPSDVKDSFKNIARILGVVINEKKDLRLSVMASLRKLITGSVERGNLEDTAELARFAKNYLPLLFNFYTIKPNGSDEEGQRLAALDTIKVYLTITSKDLAGELFDRALVKLDEPEMGDFYKESVFDLIRVLVRFTDGNKLKALYERLVPLFTDDKKHKEQKKAYRFLEEICGSDGDTCKTFVRQNRRTIQKLLIKSLPSTVTTSKGVRLRCWSHLVRSETQLKETKLLKTIVPEAVTSVKHTNKKCRMSAYQLLSDVAEKLLDDAQHFKELIELLITGLAGAPTYCSATLLALASVTYNYNGSLGAETIQRIFEHACLFVTVPTREIVLSALSYVKVYLSVMPSPVIAPNLSTVVKALSGMTDDCKRHFRLKVRDLLIKLTRKYGVDAITEMIPTSDEVMRKRLKNIRKVQTRKQKSKELKKMKEAGEGSDEEFNVKSRPRSVEEILADSDEDFDDTEETDEPKNVGRRKASRRKTWIQENEDHIVDFVDPTAVKCITATQPGMSSIDRPKRKVKKTEFKTAPDGRLIIKDDDVDDDDDDASAGHAKVVKKNKKKAAFSEIDSEKDSDIEDAKSVISVKTTGRKRKLSDSTDAASTRAPAKYQAGGSGIHRLTKAPKVDKIPGIEYRAKKARGDIKKKGKLDPFTYLPLTRSTLNRRKRMKNAGRFKNLVAGAKRGAQIGTKNRKRDRRV